MAIIDSLSNNSFVNRDTQKITLWVMDVITDIPMNNINVGEMDKVI